ncbi:helix-turn-helix transcriptional regulator [Streptomyces sp. AC536]|uniref:helix-turn-helix domain-containing protein n=1 Tax=Streptomyces buecherae TaxID=2763006 RepID=UPI00164DC04B|nr:helix-turn-helix transcriptional regulator [Streptomyces buecherae]MBC3985535.1 helix-turn-helix transcriptional regulator [Streptomyces buecherae]QNJ41901.1 helix-turn-helix transcriptional regulator [Streptomyces buecherae]
MVNRKDLNPDSSPRAAYGARLRRHRENRGWTQEQLADRLGLSSQHVSAVETARKPPTLPFSRKADDAFGVANTAESFERQWRDIRHGNLLEGFPEYIGLEGRAVEVRVFEIGIIPGLLQTPAYARSIAQGDVRRGTISPEQAEERLAFLTDRQAALTRPRPPTVMAVMDESCIRRRVGGDEVMREQLAHLEEFSARPNTMLQIAPFGIGERRPFDLPIYLLTMTDRSMVAYAESHAQGHLERESSFVLAALTNYHQLQAESLSQAESVAMVNQVRKGAP